MNAGTGICLLVGAFTGMRSADAERRHDELMGRSRVNFQRERRKTTEEWLAEGQAAGLPPETLDFWKLFLNNKETPP